MPAKLNLLSMYITNKDHAINLMEYAGNKLEAQLVELSDGSYTALEEWDPADWDTIVLQFEDGSSKKTPYHIYQDRIENKINPTVAYETKTTVYINGKERKIDQERFLRYMGFRTSAQTAEGQKHGLFNPTGDTDMKAEVQRIRDLDKCLVWAHVFSMRREDAAMWHVPRNLTGENPRLKERRIEAIRRNYTAYTSEL